MSGIFCIVSVACCCGLCVPNMTITKANAKENLGEFIFAFPLRKRNWNKSSRFSFVIISVRMVTPLNVESTPVIADQRPLARLVRKEPEGKNTKGKNFWKLRGRKKCSQKIFQKISQKKEDITFTGFYSISGYLRNLRGRLLSSEKFSEVFTLWVLPLSRFQLVGKAWWAWKLSTWPQQKMAENSSLGPEPDVPAEDKQPRAVGSASPPGPTLETVQSAYPQRA